MLRNGAEDRNSEWKARTTNKRVKGKASGIQGGIERSWKPHFYSLYLFCNSKTGFKNFENLFLNSLLALSSLKYLSSTYMKNVCDMNF